MQSARRRYALLVFLFCNVLSFTVIGLVNNTASLYIQPVSDALGVPRSLFSISSSIMAVASASCTMFMGLFMKRFRQRTLLLLGCSFHVIGMLLYAVAAALPLFYLGSLLIGMGMGFTSMTAITLLINAWFDRHIGVIFGVLYTASGIGGMLFSPWIGSLIESAGHSRAYLVTACIMVGTLLAAIFCAHSNPAEKGFVDDDKDKAGARTTGKPAAAPGMTLAVMARRWQFWAGALMMFGFGFVDGAVQRTLAAFIVDSGQSVAFAASLTGFLYITNTVCKIPMGMLCDRGGVRLSLVLCGCCMVVSMGLAVWADGVWSLYVLSGFAGIGIIFFTVPGPMVASTMFGKGNLATITGVYMSCMTAGMAFGTPVTNALREWTGNYRFAFIVLLVMLAALTAIAAIAVKPQYRPQQAEASVAAE